MVLTSCTSIATLNDLHQGATQVDYELEKNTIPVKKGMCGLLRA